MKRKLLMGSIILYLAIIISIPALAEDIEETVKYKPPTMDQTVDYIQGITPGFVGFESGECMLTTTMVINSVAYEYHIPLKELDPSPSYVSTRLACVTLTVPRNQKKILRIGRDNKEKLKQKVDICTDNRESAQHLATAMRFLIVLCAGKPCNNCPPFPWQK